MANDALIAAFERASGQAHLAGEYAGLIGTDDPAKLGRLAEIANALGYPADRVAADAASVRSVNRGTGTASPPPPAPDLSKLNGAELIALGAKPQDRAGARHESGTSPARAAAPSKDQSAMTSQELIRLGLSQQAAPRLPQSPESKPR